MSEAATTTTTTETTAPETVTMSQADLEKLIGSRVSAAVAGVEKKFKAAPVPEAVAKELEDLRAAKAERERQEMERKGEYDKALAAQKSTIDAQWEPLVKERDEKLSKSNDKLREVIVTNALLSAAAEGNAVAPAQVVRLLDNRVKLNDEMVPVVYDENGSPAFAPDGKPMTPAQLVEGFLRGNPHFVKAVLGKSGGATGGPVAKAGEIANSEIDAKAKEVEELGKEVTRTGSPVAIAKFTRANKELAALKQKAATPAA